MTHPDPTPRRRPDGSIDTAHYIAAGRRARAETARHLASALTPDRPGRRAPRIFRGLFL